MNKTTNYQLNQWEAADRVQRTDFNADNAAVDSALAALNTRVGSAEGTISGIGGRTADLESAVSALSSGAVKIATGSYVGNGNYGEDNPVTLSFDFSPQLVFVQYAAGSGTGADTSVRNRNTFILIRPLQAFCIDSAKANVPVQWGDQSVSWYSTATAPAQLNGSLLTYIYLAIG